MLKENLLLRHTLMGTVALSFVLIFWMSRPEWTEEMRLWRAVGDGAFMMLFLTLVVGPMAKLWGWARQLVPWRRETGIWFGLLSLVHGILTLTGWVKWDLNLFFGYEFVAQLGRNVRIEPGFGLANLLGLAALFWTLVLTATSSNWAMRKLGGSSWKWLHNGAYIVFYLVTFHSFYFLFIHYTISFHRTVPEPNWFRYPFLALALTVPLLQTAGFLKTVRQKREVPEPAVAAGKRVADPRRRTERRQDSRA